ncbi:MAG TPA: response regulator transcription factor [Ktedonobacteraceae bacterium]|nr:response regulator transcription factor [Ktedonobacteraceae bacterium]
MHILVVEDERKMAALLRRVLTEERHNVDLAYDGPSGLDLALSDTYDIMILDLMLPGLDGIEICRQVRAQRIAMPILMLTARKAVEDRVKGLRMGADDYLGKPFSMEELLARVDALLRRREQAFEKTSELRVGELTLNLIHHEARRNGRSIELTSKEFALLEFLMRHPRQVLTRTQIIDHVWRYDQDASSKIVDIYIHYLRDKVDQGYPHALIKTVRGVGYKIEEES